MKKILNTKKAPAPIGPYNQSVEANGLLFVSGQIPVIPETGELVKGPAADQARQSLKNIAAILENAGLSFENVVKTVVFLSDINDFASVNAVYAECFPSESAPARSCVEVANLPKGVAVEIEVIAAL
ncbi:RidA family protein [bacterium]|nr:RidA family protein [bacterium]